MLLGLDTRLVLLSAGLMFLWALGLGVVKYVQIRRSPDAHAHPYIDMAHRAALLYSFALLLVAVFVELSAWSTAVNLTLAGLLAFYFVGAVGSYMNHGLRGDTDNQLRAPVSAPVRGLMVTLIVAEIGGFALLLAGFVSAQF